jgi:uncharacterized protein YuzE
MASCARRQATQGADVEGKMIEYSDDVDIVYIHLSRKRITRTVIVDDGRIVDYDAAGEVVGVELLWASQGLDLRGLPEQERLQAQLRVLRFPVIIE